MILVLWWEFSIHESDIIVICKHIFLMFQALIFDVATIIYQCCDGPVHIYLGGYLYIISDVATIIYQCCDEPVHIYLGALL